MLVHENSHLLEERFLVQPFQVQQVLEPLCTLVGGILEPFISRSGPGGFARSIMQAELEVLAASGFRRCLLGRPVLYDHRCGS